MADTSFFTGQQSVIRFFFNGAELRLNTKSWSVKPDVTKINDSVCGEDADRLDRVVNFWSFEADCLQRDLQIFDAYIADVANDNLAVAPLDKGAGVRFKLRDGTKKVYAGREFVFDESSISASGRSDRTGNKITFRCRYFTSVKSAS